MEEIQNDDGSIFFRGRQSIENGGTALLIASFNTDQTVVDLNIFNIVTINDPLKKEYLHKLLNELNCQFRYTKFTESNGEVVAQYSYRVQPNNLDPEDLIDNLVMLFKTVEQSHPKFMKLQWS
jgi:hypothetical protein